MLRQFSYIYLYYVDKNHKTKTNLNIFNIFGSQQKKWCVVFVVQLIVANFFIIKIKKKTQKQNMCCNEHVFMKRFSKLNFLNLKLTYEKSTLWSLLMAIQIQHWVASFNINIVIISFFRFYFSFFYLMLFIMN